MKTIFHRLALLSMLLPVTLVSPIVWQADMLVTQPEDSDCQADLPRIFTKIAKLIQKEIDPNAIILANGEIRGVDIPDIGLGRNPCTISGYCKSYPNTCLLLGCPLGGLRRELALSTSDDDSTSPPVPTDFPSEQDIERLGTRRLRKLRDADPACKVEELEFFFHYK